MSQTSDKLRVHIGYGLSVCAFVFMCVCTCAYILRLLISGLISIWRFTSKLFRFRCQVIIVIPVFFLEKSTNRQLGEYDNVQTLVHVQSVHYVKSPNKSPTFVRS